MVSWKPWALRYPACFGLCCFVKTERHLRPHLHLQDELGWCWTTWIIRGNVRKEISSHPTTPSSLQPSHHLLHPDKGGWKGQADLLVKDLPPQTGELRLRVHLHLCLSEGQQDSPSFSFPPSQSLIALCLLSEAVDHSASNSHHRRKIAEK